MRKITLRVTVAILVSWLYVAGTFASNQFVPKDYSFTDIGKSWDVTINIPMTDLFVYPDGMDKTANLDEAGVTATFEYTDETVVGLYRYEYYNYGKVQQLYLQQKAKKTGKADVKVILEYNGVKVENLLKIDIVSMIAKDDNYVVDLGQTCKAPVLFNDNFMDNNAKNTATLTIDEQPVYGTATILSGGTTKPDTIQYIPNADLENYSFDQLKYTVTLADGSESSSAIVKFNIHKNAYASKVIAFMPAPGQFTNEGIAQKNSAEKTLGNQGGMISLGSFGGYVIYGFDQPIKNDPRHPYGVDFTVRGNSFVANLYGVWTEPGAVQVCQDLNGNGIPDPDEPWYELAGSDYWLSTTKHNVEMTYYNPSYDKRYTVPWTTDKGESGAVLSNQFHSHSYFPDPFDFECDRDSLTYSGNIIRSSIDMSSPSYIEFYRAPAFGYCDNRGYNKTDLTIASNPYYNDERGNAADGFDISWAVDKDGNHVELDHVDFVKVYCAGSANAGWLGEWSTEVLGVAITTPEPDYVPKDYYLNYIGITQLQVIRGQECQYEGFLFKNGRPIHEGEQKWWLSTDTVGTIDNTGKFSATGLGSTWIYFSQKEDIPHDSIQIDVVDLKKVVIDIEGNASTVSNDSINMILGETIYIETQCDDSRGESLNGRNRNRYIYEKFRWTTSNPEIGIINNGSFHGKKVGRTMLHVYSTSNPELSDSILVIVNDVPQITPISDPLKIAYYEPEGILTSSALFTAGNSSTIYLEDVKGITEKVYTLAKNALNYQYSQGEYLTDTLTFNVTHYGQKKTLKLPVIYAPDVLASSRRLLFADKNIVKAYVPESNETKAIIAGLKADSIHALTADGAFTYIATNDSLYRYNTPGAECTHKVQTLNKATVDKLLTTRNLLIASSHTANETYTISIYYKTDMELVRTIKLSKPIQDMVVVGDNLYLIISNEEKSAMGIINLNTFELEKEVTLNTKGLNTSTLVAKDNMIYGIRAYDPVKEEEASILEFNTTNNTSTLIPTGGIEAFFEGVPTAIKPMTGDSILLSNYKGFSVYNTKKREILDGTFMEGQRIYPTEAIRDTTNGNYYVAYADQDVTYYQGAIYDKDFNKQKDIYNLGKTPANLQMMNDVADNEAPKVSKGSVGYGSTPYDRATEPGSYTLQKSAFTDKENNYSIYVRSIEQYNDWLNVKGYKDNGDIELKMFYRGDVDSDSLVTFTVEAIDNVGLSASRQVELKITPEIYKPLVVNALKDTAITTKVDTLRLSLKDVFKYPSTSTWGKTFTKTVVANDNPILITDSIDVTTDSLVLITSKGQTGTAQITLRYTVAFSEDNYMYEYGGKYVDTSFAVKVSAPVGIEDTQIDANSIVTVLQNPFKDHLVVRVQENGTAELYNVAGQSIMIFNLKAGENTVNTTQLANGTYLLKYKETVVKVIKQ